MSATLLRDGTRGDIARSAHPYLVTLIGTGFIPLMASFLKPFGRGEGITLSRDVVHINHSMSHLYINDIPNDTTYSGMPYSHSN
jgi:hypothetical protein